jgi:hypothetical protein
MKSKDTLQVVTATRFHKLRRTENKQNLRQRILDQIFI